MAVVKKGKKDDLRQTATGLTQVIFLQKIRLQIAARQSTLFQVLLVIVFCAEECGGRDDLRHDWSPVPASFR
jgi:hypothetical protein